MSNLPDKPLCNIGVAITRPTSQATKLTKLIHEAGGHVIQFPLIEIASIADYTGFNRVIAGIGNADWLLFISSNAVQNGMPLLLKQGIPDNIKFAAIGPKTAQALKSFDVDQVLVPEGRFDSESLLALPEMHHMQNKNVLIVRGIGGRELLANTLKARGANVQFAECYRRINPQKDDDILEKAYANQQLQSIIVTSSEAMRYLLDLANNASWLKNINICVNHARIAEQPIAMGLQVSVAEAPGDEAMMSLLINVHS